MAGAEPALAARERPALAGVDGERPPSDGAPGERPPVEPAGGLLGVFAVPGFRGLWLSAAAGTFARTVAQLALSWLTLQLTGSPFLVGLVLAARMAPQFALGIPAGVLADWFDRRALMLMVGAAGTALALGIAGAAAGGLLALPWLLLATLALGALDTARTTATQAHAYDLLRATRAIRGIAVTNLGGQLLGALGGLAGGLLLERAGVGAAFLLVALAWAVVSLAAGAATAQAGVTDAHAPLGPGTTGARAAAPTDAVEGAAPAGQGRTGAASAVPSGAMAPVDAPHQPPQVGISGPPTAPDAMVAPPAVAPAATAAPARRPRPSFRRAAALLARNPYVRTLALAVVLAEVFGFANQTLLPTFARDIFAVGAAGLGTLTFARSAGGVVGLLVLAQAGTARISLGLFLLVTAGLALALVLFAATPLYPLALLLVALVGAAGGALDSLGQALLQRHVDERERGAAMGIWVFSVGFGPIGLIGLGAAAGLVGAPTAQTVSGALLLLAVALLGLSAPHRRRG